MASHALVRVAIITDEHGLGQALSAEVQDAGYQAELEIHHADIVLVDGDVADYQKRIRAAMAQNPRADIMALLRPAQLEDVPPEVGELVVKPTQPGEVGARLRLWAQRRGLAGTSRQALLAHAVEGAADVVEITDPNAVLSYVNPAFTELLGYTAEEVIGKTPAQVMRSSVHSKEYFQEIDRTLRRGVAWKGLLISRSKDGRLVHFDATVSPVFDAAGRCTHHVAVKRDITERLATEARLRATNEELEQARDAALEASRIKSQFLANMSHELRTPLNAIIGYSELIGEEAEDLGMEGIGKDADKIRTAGKHLLGLINDILDLSKIEAGKVELYLEDVALPEVLEEAVATLAPLARERGNTIRLDNRLAAQMIKADTTRLKQILFNLLSNANKFTEDGTIEVEVTADPANADAFLIAVTDSGIGMSPEVIQRLFQPFAQADASTTRKYGGTGLGLTISQRFCELMGGQISVRSVEGEGSTFTVCLPLVAGDVPRKRRTTPAGAARRRILLIDDDRAIHDLLLRTLEPAGFEVLSARGGQLGLERARADSPDVIVLDVVMPGMDGWSVLTSLKKDEATSDIPVVMLTFLESRSAGLALGAADYLIKPVETSRLVKIIRRHCGALPATILVVEDDESTRDLMRRVLAGAGHSVHTAGNGQQALEVLSGARPDLILLDLMMPEVDGFTFLDRIREQEQHRDIPVVVVTAKHLTPGERHRLEGATQQLLRKGEFSSKELMSAVLRNVSVLLRPTP